jgi:adenosine deaminase
MNSETKDYIRRLPKAELHVHLEGSVGVSSLASLAKKYKTEIAGISPEELRRRSFVYDDFQGFLNTYRLVCQHLREPEDYLVILDSLYGLLEDQNIFYAEVFFSPSIPWKLGRDGQEVLSALTERSTQYEAKEGVVVIRWVLDCVRQFDIEMAERTAELAAEFSQKGVIAVGVGGDENSRPLREFEEVFSWVRSHELFAHVHAGEIGEPEQVWEAVQLLGANRIGHGIQAARDSKLMEYLREHTIGLDICLTSNAKTRAWPFLGNHPLPLLMKRGVPVTLNTDDPGLFETTLNQEYEAALRLFELSEADLQRLSLQGIHSSFLSHEKKMQLMELFNGKIQEL